MRLLFIVIALVAVWSRAQAQYTVSGRIAGSVDLAEILLQTNDSLIVKKEFSDEKGNFKIIAAEGNYTLKINRLGKTVYHSPLQLDKNIDLGDLKIGNTEVLQEVVIEKKKKLIERKVDRLVFNVENSVASQGMDATQALSNTPMVKVDANNGISIVGKSGVSVMVNDRMLNLSGSELVNYLQSLRSDNIAKIEVITTPPAKYEAQGNSGIINIILKKNPVLGWSGNVSSTYVRKTFNGYINIAALNYQSERFSTSLKLRHYDRKKKSVERTSVQGDNSVYSTDVREDMNKGIGGNLSLDYTLSEKSKIGAIYDFNMGKLNMDIHNASIYKTGSVTDSLLTTNSQHRYNVPSHTLSVFYEQKLDTLGKKLNITGNYFSNIPDNKINFRTLNTQTEQSTTVRNYSVIDYAIWSGQADLVLPYDWVNLETGTKYTLFRNASDIQYFNFLQHEYVLDPNNSNLFRYNEQNLAGYLSMHKNFSEQWSAKAGLRYEYSIIEGLTPATGEKTTKHYGKWFPSLYVVYKPTNNHVLSVNYSRRINRPFFRALNPYRWYSNTYTYAEGNPLLQPSYNDNIELGYSFKNKLSFTLYQQFSDDNYGQVVSFNDGYKIVGYQNYFRESKTGLTVNYVDTFFSFWESSVNLNTYHTQTKGLYADIVGQQSFSFYYTTNNTITLNKDKTMFLLLNFWQALPYTYGNSYIKGSYEFSPGLKMALLDKKLQVNAVINDVFRSDRGRGNTTYTTISTTYDNYYDGRTLTLSATYNFGNNKVKGATSNIKFDEKNRAN